MRYLIAGASTFGVDNMGDDAMLSCLIRGIRLKDKKSSIVFLARHPSNNFDKLFGVKSIKNLDHNSNKAALNRFFLGFNFGDSRSNLKKIKYELEKADILIIGGNSLMEISENTFMKGVSSYASLLALLAIFFEKPYALFGLNIVEPMKSKFFLNQAKFLIENSIITTVREKQALNFLKLAKISTKNIKVTTDPAYGLELHKVNKFSGQSILQREKLTIDLKKRLISICIREEYWQTNKKKIDRLKQEIKRIVLYILKDPYNQIIFIPNCFYTKGHPLENDRSVNKIIKKHIGDSSRIFYINRKLNLFETLAIFKLIDIHISNRRHSNIFAALFSKPFIPITTSLKSHITSFVKELKQEKYLSNGPNLSSQVSKKLKLILLNYKSVKKKLRHATKKQINKALFSATKILEVYKSR